jgi:hypothetical protein
VRAAVRAQRKVDPMFTSFLPRPEMRAIELAHYVTMPVPLNLATLIADELGAASYRGEAWSAWFADAVVEDDAGAVVIIPIALRIDMQGNATIQVPFVHGNLWVEALRTMAPIMMVPLYNTLAA